MKITTLLRNSCCFAIMTLALISCTSTVNEEAQLESLVIAYGPFFEGPNSLMADYQVNMQELVQKEAYTPQDIESVKIKEITVSLLESDSINMDVFSSVALSIVSSNEGMTAIANLNPVESKDNQITLTSSEEADLAPFFNEGKFTLVLDWNFNEDDYRDELSSIINMNLNLELIAK